MAGIPYYRELVFVIANYTNAVVADIGRAVIGGDSTDSGKLVEYDNVSRKWIVNPDDTEDLFDVAEAITITEGTGAGTTKGASTEFIYFSEPKDVEDPILRSHSLYKDHNKAADDVRDRLRKRGYTDSNLDTLLITRNMKQFCIYHANYYTCLRNFKNKTDTWHEKMEEYRELANAKWTNLEIAFDADGSNTIADGERSHINVRLIR